MRAPERFSDLPEYAFPRLRALLDSHAPGGEPLSLSIGEPRHPFPGWVSDVVAENADGFGRYPPNDGAPELLEAIGRWLHRRYNVDVDAEREIMALNGSREGLFNAVLALCPETAKTGGRPAVLMPNPFYQVYAVGALAAGAEPVYVPATRETGFLPDYAALPAELLERTEIAFLCSPSNPQGAVASHDYWRALIELAERHDFRVFADECYSEIWRDAPPLGALQVAREIGADPERVVIFNSLSKRSNLPGLRSGFVAGGAETLKHLKRLRAYAGAPLPLPLQRVAQRAWNDESHVVENRALYQQKYRIADEILGQVPGYFPPQGGFFLWLAVEDGEAAALKLWREAGIRVLPGAYLGRGEGPENPGHGFIRVAMVAEAEELRRALIALRDCLY
jgi:aspartate/methionine/tyrosine aminotransferase